MLVVPKGQKGKGFYVGAGESDIAEQALANEFDEWKRNKKKEQLHDIANSGIYDAMNHMSPRRASHLKVGDQIVTARDIASDKTRKGWTEINRGPEFKHDFMGEAVTITDIDTQGKNITLKGKYTTTTRKGITVVHEVKKQFHKNDTFAIYSKRAFPNDEASDDDPV